MKNQMPISKGLSQNCVEPTCQLNPEEPTDLEKELNSLMIKRSDSDAIQNEPMPEPATPDELECNSQLKSFNATEPKPVEVT